VTSSAEEPVGRGGPPAGGPPTGGGGAGGGGAPTFELPDAGALAPPPVPAGPGPQCAEEAHRAEVVPLDLLLLVDASGSMDGAAGMRSKWETAQAALSAFIRDPRSAGLGVGLQFFPAARACLSDGDCVPGFPGTGTLCAARRACSTSRAPCATVGQACAMNGGTCMPAPGVCRLVYPDLECEQAVFETAAVPIGPLPAAQAALLQSLSNKEPSGGTPMGPAVRGALVQLRAHRAAHPGRKVALILAGDGLPEQSCAMNDIPAVAADLGAAFMGTPSIPTYVIGVFAPAELMTSQMQLDRLAMAGGSGQAFVLAANDDLTMRLQEALDQIRGAALACEYEIPPPTAGRIDFARVNVRYTSASGPQNVPYVEQAGRCDPAQGGWYFDVLPSTGAPTRILACDATCRRFKSDPNGRVDLVFGCATQVIN
jgi:hypothetical protein